MEANEPNKKVKCLVWDLDQTLWEGILTEGEVNQLKPGVVELIQTLDQRGIIQSIASKNEFAPAIEKLKSFGIDEYFLYPQINWGNKSESVQRIREALNIGMDTIAFVDDQIFERDEVAFVHPEVRCYDAADLFTLSERDEFIPRFITDESALRRKMYQADSIRLQEEKTIGNNAEFLKQLQLIFSIKRATTEDLKRIEELTLRTNQLNATGYTYSYDELIDLLKRSDYHIWVCSLEDKYGSYGKIGVAMIHEEQGNWHIKLLLMSCRVMSRGVGTVLLHFLIQQSMLNQVKLYAEFHPTESNRIMYITYKFAGFEEVEKWPDGGVQLLHQQRSEYAYPSHLQIQFPDTQMNAL